MVTTFSLRSVARIRGCLCVGSAASQSTGRLASLSPQLPKQSISISLASRGLGLERNFATYFSSCRTFAKTSLSQRLPNGEEVSASQWSQSIRISRAFASSSSTKVKTMKDWEANLDPVQKKLLEEECIVLDADDKVIGHDSKKNCHLIRNNGDILLHRAFSVFLFNSKGQLLMQQRSKTKITFPHLWTNSCCSHPLYFPEEMVEGNAEGIKTAAKRRMEFELGIDPGAIKPEEFQYLTRIHYKASSNNMWGEHEIDYILFLQKDLDLKPNPDEVEEVRYVSLEDIKKMSRSDGVQLTPWFDLIYKTWLPIWWNNLANLEKFEDHKKIYRM